MRGTPWSPASGLPGQGTAAQRQRVHPGPAAEARSGHCWQPSPSGTPEVPGAPGAGADLQRLEQAPTGLPGDRPGGPLRWSIVGFLHPQPGGPVVGADVCTGWTEAVPLLARDQSLVLAGLEAIRRQLPFVIRGIDSDNDGAFINETLLEWTAQQGIEFTRSRTYRSNDQA